MTVSPRTVTGDPLPKDLGNACPPGWMSPRGRYNGE